jgi:hypothetical protein
MKLCRRCFDQETTDRAWAAYFKKLPPEVQAKQAHKRDDYEETANTIMAHVDMAAADKDNQELIEQKAYPKARKHLHDGHGAGVSLKLIKIQLYKDSSTAAAEASGKYVAVCSFEVVHP